MRLILFSHRLATLCCSVEMPSIPTREGFKDTIFADVLTLTSITDICTDVAKYVTSPGENTSFTKVFSLFWTCQQMKNYFFLSVEIVQFISACLLTFCRNSMVNNQHIIGSLLLMCIRSLTIKILIDFKLFFFFFWLLPFSGVATAN